MIGSHVRRCSLAAVLVAVLGASGGASAQDAAAGEALFNEGKQLAGEGKWAEACPKFEASQKADPSLGTLLNWADCLEKQGRLGSALERFAEAEQKLAAAGDPRAEVAKERRTALEPRAPRMVLRSTSQAPTGIRVFADGEPVPLDAIATEGGVQRPIDPGVHAVEVRRGEVVLERREEEAREGATSTIELDLAAIARAHPEAAPPRPPPSTPTEEPSATPRIVGWILVGTGGTAILVAGTLEIVALGLQSDSEASGHCHELACSPEGFDESQRAGDLAEAGQWVGLVGIGALAVGVTLVLTAPDGEPASKARGGPSLALKAAPGRVALGGSF